ncbi:Ohr subfamily peroxiredoxin [Paraburkholderia sp. WSM4179]|nr:Ohr subfamily peroxiredoxin [Paraburkholderia sp. WSM4179]
MKFVAGQRKQALPADTQVSADVGIGPNDKGGFALDIDMRITLPGLAADAARELVDAAHQVCPYSNATRNNVAVRLHVA